MDFHKFFNDIRKKKVSLSTKEKIFRAKAGIICPRCGKCSMEYDGLLNLRCKVCGYLSAGSHT